MNFEKIYKKLDELLKLPKGWNSYGSKTISKECVLEAKSILVNFSNKEFITPNIIPLSNGGIKIEWNLEDLNKPHDDRYIDIEINIPPPNLEVSYYIENGEGVSIIDKLFNEENDYNLIEYFLRNYRISSNIEKYYLIYYTPNIEVGEKIVIGIIVENKGIYFDRNQEKLKNIFPWYTNEEIECINVDLDYYNDEYKYGEKNIHNLFYSKEYSLSDERLIDCSDEGNIQIIIDKFVKWRSNVS